MDVFKAYALGTAGWLAVEATPLLLTPRLIVSLVASEPRRITDLETYLCRSFGLTLYTLAFLLLLLTGLVPLSTTSVDAETEQRAYAYPTLIISTIYHALTAFYLYTQLTYTWNFAFTAGLTGSVALFCLGVWTVLFGSEQGRVSKSTGADKRTSNWPFENKESAREKKKEAKEREREGKRRSISKVKARE